MSKDNKSFFKEKNSWSEIKDRLLGSYLPAYFQKVLMTHRPILYVDCFAGKGKFDDNKDGSPRIALRVREERLNATNADIGSATIDVCFIELNHADELTQNVSDFNIEHGEKIIISGRYEEEIEKLLSEKKEYNVFLYIDPYGIRELDFDLLVKFSTYELNSIEMLINMNTFGFFRAACQVMQVDKVQQDEAFQDSSEIVEYDPTEFDESTKSKDLLNSIAGGTYWQAIVQDYKSGVLDGYKAERRFSTEYKQHLRQHYKYVLDMPIRMKPNHRPKYRMIHVSNHEHGCILMADNIASRKDELFIDIQDEGQTSLFDQTAENDIISPEGIQQKMHDLLKSYPQGIHANKLLAEFYTEYGVLCKSGKVKSVWKTMEDSGLIEVSRVPSTTSAGRKSRFYEETKGKTVTIKRRA